MEPSRSGVTDAVVRSLDLCLSNTPAQEALLQSSVCFVPAAQALGKFISHTLIFNFPFVKPRNVFDAAVGASPLPLSAFPCSVRLSLHCPGSSPSQAVLGANDEILTLGLNQTLQNHTQEGSEMKFLSTLSSCFQGGEGRRVFTRPLKRLERERDLRRGLPGLFSFRCYLAVGVLPKAATSMKSFFDIEG